MSKKSLLLVTVFIFFIFVFAGCGSGNSATDGDYENDNIEEDGDLDISERESDGDNIEEDTAEASDKEDGDTEMDIDAEYDNDTIESEEVTEEDSENFETETESIEGRCLTMNGEILTDDPLEIVLGKVVNGGSISKHATICNRCPDELKVDIIASAENNGACDGLKFDNLVIAGEQIDLSDGNYYKILPYGLKQNECAEFDFIFDSMDFLFYPAVFDCMITTGMTDGYSYKFHGETTTADSMETTQAECPSKRGMCYINNTCYADGKVNPDNQCQNCDAEQNPSAWSTAENIQCTDLNLSTFDDRCASDESCSGTSGNTTPDIIAVSSTHKSNCVITGDNKLYCWGRNDTGQVGTGSEENFVYHPTEVTGITGKVIQVKTGYRHSCALTDLKTLWCWGENDYGQLANEENSSSRVPTKVLGIDNAVSVSVNGKFSCAVLEDKTVKCWGKNDFGQLGDGTNESRNIPTTVKNISGAVQISTGYSNACVLLEDKTIKCWGKNEKGQLGDQTQVNRNEPVSVIDIDNAVSVQCGDEHTCAILEDKTVKCWGMGIVGQLGNGEYRNYVVPVKVLNLDDCETLDAGNWTNCAIKTGGVLQCWGLGGDGQLGNGVTGSEGDSNYPVDILYQAETVKMVSTGKYHTCAVFESGTLKCWGANGSAQLGRGSEDSNTYSYPVDVIW